MSSKTSKLTKPAKTPSHLVTVWVPKSHVSRIDADAANKDIDRSKWIREAIREKAGIRATG